MADNVRADDGNSKSGKGDSKTTIVPERRDQPPPTSTPRAVAVANGEKLSVAAAADNEEKLRVAVAADSVQELGDAAAVDEEEALDPDEFVQRWPPTGRQAALRRSGGG